MLDTVVSMNERVPESSGLPLRAMVMVLLFLGVTFALLGFQQMSSGDAKSESTSQSISATSTAAARSSSAPAPAPRPEVRVFNISGIDGAAQTVTDKLKAEGWDVVETGNLSLPDTSVNTVFYSTAPGERDSATQIGGLLAAPVEERNSGVANLPPGVIVVVTG